jgi:hypothetical protein
MLDLDEPFHGMRSLLAIGSAPEQGADRLQLFLGNRSVDDETTCRPLFSNAAACRT